MKTGNFKVELTRAERVILIKASETLQAELVRRSNGVLPTTCAVARAHAAVLNKATAKLRAAAETELTFGSNGAHLVNGRWVVARRGDWTGHYYATRDEASAEIRKTARLTNRSDE